MDYRFEEAITEEKRSTDLDAIIERGNHKSADKRKEHMMKALRKDVTHRFSLPILPTTVKGIKGAMAQPLRMAKQLSLSKLGKIVPKYRLTQDLSFSLTDKKISLNTRINMDAYVEIIYEWCLPRIVHYTVALCRKFLTKRIFISNYDYRDAYRQISHSASAAIQSIALFGGLAFIALRLTFSRSPNPPTWCMFSETVTNLANKILLCEDWDPAQLHNPDQGTTPEPKIPYNGPGLTPALPTAVEIPLTSTARMDGFIDNLICVFLDTPEGPEPLTRCHWQCTGDIRHKPPSRGRQH
jgi:hypothetical protein